MSFAFDWEAFAANDLFLEKCKRLLNVALNKNTPSIIEGPITVAELSWGDEAPTLETLEIGEVGNDRFRGIFKLNYTGNSRLTLATKVQANLLNVYAQTAPEFTRPGFLGSSNGLSIPLNLTLSEIKMSGIVICVFSRAKGLTCVFRNDPLQSIKVSSTFDGIPGIATFLQSQIENLIGGLFREELPAILYSHSQIWTKAGQDELLSQAQRLGGHENFLREHMELQQQLQLDHADEDAPVTFAEIDADKQISLVNTLCIEAMNISRRTLALNAPVVATTILRSELSRRHAVAAAAVPVSIGGAQIHDHVHAQAQRLALKHNHKPRRRVLNLRRKKEETPESETTAPASFTPPRAELHRTNSTPIVSSQASQSTAAQVTPAPTPVEFRAPTPVASTSVVPPVSPAVTPTPASAPVSASASASNSTAPVMARSSSSEVPSETSKTAKKTKGSRDSSIRVAVPPTSTKPLAAQTKVEIERIKNMIYSPKTNFFVPNAKLPYEPEQDQTEEEVLDAPPAYVA